MESEHSSNTTESDDELPPPVGTLFVLMIYIMALAGMWGAIYIDFLGR